MQGKKILLAATLPFLLWSAIPAQAQRSRTLEAVIHTPLASTAREICRGKGGNLIIEVQFSIFHCYFDSLIKQAGTKR